MQIEFMWKERGIMFTGSTWSGFIRLCRDWDGRWQSRWVLLPWFGYKRTIRVRRTNPDAVTEKVRTQHIHRAWCPYLLFFLSRNVRDNVTITVPKDAILH